MTYLYVILPLLSFVSSHNIGLILNSDQPETISAIKHVANFTLSNLDNATELITKEYSSSHLSLIDTICALLDENVTALISASTSTIAATEADIASQFHIPIIAAVATDPYLKTADRDYLVLLSPSDKYQSRAILDILKKFNWLEFSILASADSYGVNGVVYLQSLATRDSSFNIMDVQHFEVLKDLGQFDITKELQLIRNSLARVIVLNCGGEYAKIIFREAEAMGLMSTGFVWIVTDAITGEPETLAYDGSFPSYYRGIIGIVPALGEDTDKYNSFRDRYITQYGGSSADIMMPSIMVSDAIAVIHHALSGLDEMEWDLNTPGVSCSSTDTWDGGEIMFNNITDNTYSGISGDITFDKTGVVTTASYDIMNFVKDSFHKIGSWTNSTRLKLGNKYIVYLGGNTTTPSGICNTLSGFHLRVGIVEEPPIAYHKNECSIINDTTSPDCWNGWNPDIIQRLAKDLNFTYEYVQPVDLKYGGFDEEAQSWNGMVNDILNKKTDLTTALSINTQRREYIHFTLSFFEDQASFIYDTEPTRSAANMLFFLMPFKIGIWTSLFGIIAVIAFFVTLLSKLSPYGKYGRKIHAHQTCDCEKCQKKRDMKTNNKCRFVDTKEFDCEVDAVEEEDFLDDMSFYNSLWTVSTGLVQQGGETLPHAPSGRFLLFFWWLFVMILVSMYTANLAAYLTLERSTISITSLTDLLEQKEYEWGLIIDRNLESTMKNHENPKYTELVDKGLKLKNLQDGKDKVKEGRFIFIDEGSVLTFNFKDECSTTQTNTNKFSNEWAFGLQPNSPYEDLINHMFLRYREEGWFTDIWDKWYTAETQCRTVVGSGDRRFGISILSGLYGLFSIGITCSFILVGLETLYAAHVDSMCSTSNEGFWVCLKRRLSLKKEEICQEWFRKKRVTHGEDNNERAATCPRRGRRPGPKARTRTIANPKSRDWAAHAGCKYTPCSNGTETEHLTRVTNC